MAITNTSTNDDGSSHGHISEKVHHLHSTSPEQPFWSLEYFPPKTNQGQANLLARIQRMNTSLHPSWNNITWGAGGSTQVKSLELAGRCQSGQLDPTSSQNSQTAAVDTCLHLTCTNVDEASLKETLSQAHKVGIKNILALRGDPPRGQEYWIANDNQFQYSLDLIQYITKHYGDYFNIGVAAYPEGYADHHQFEQDINTDLQYLKQKQEAGAKFIITQLFYDVDKFIHWYHLCRQQGITIPIIPGIMPIQNYSSFRRMTNLCKASVPSHILQALEPIRFDDAAVKEYGVQLSIQIIARLYLEAGIRGFHLCTLNLEKSVQRVLEGLGWVSSTGAQAANADYRLLTTQALHRAQGKASSPSSIPTPFSNLPSHAGPESLTAWDEFPNGRYGDSRSPAFGEIDGYGVSLKVPPQDALRIWGYPVTEDDVSLIFSSYLLGKLSCIPWCDAPIFDETLAIRDWLLALNLPCGRNDKLKGKGWWTVGSQPAVDGVSSSDPTYGFGPGDGYVYQKAFVELFLSESDKKSLIKHIDSQGQGQLTYFAGNRAGSFETNLPTSPEPSSTGRSTLETSVEAVTWGVFPGKEIIQPTIIEEESFKAWCEESFEIWKEWECLFPQRSATKELFRRVGQEKWLVTVIHHDYKDLDALWRFLLDKDQVKGLDVEEVEEVVRAAPGKAL
ncbi:unnamed protein product [Sympodiomycopsis kandeliae]